MRRFLAPALFAFTTACAATAAPPAPSGPAGAMERGMGNCPSAVQGATTSFRRISGGVELDVTATDPAAVRAIVARANHDSVAGPPNPQVAPHTGAHGGTGTGGHCPVVHVDTTVSVLEIGGGVRITVLANDPSQAAALEAETKARIEWLYPPERR